MLPTATKTEHFGITVFGHKMLCLLHALNYELLSIIPDLCNHALTSHIAATLSTCMCKVRIHY